MSDGRALTAALSSSLAERLASLGVTAEITSIEPLAGGACQDNLRVELRVGDAPPERLVLRADAPSALAGSLGRAAEFHVVNAAHAAGVTTPRARWLLEGALGRPGHAYFLDFAAGVAIGRSVLERPELETARGGLVTALAAELAKIHSVTPDVALPIPGAAENAVEAALGWLDRTLEVATQPLLALELVRRWLHAFPPAPPETPRLVHGDFRLGNFLVTPSGLSAVLDWEFAHFGAPEEDLAWICVRDWRFGKNHLPVAGLARREALWGAYTAASGRALDPVVLHWWEIYGNARWAIGCLDQAERYRAGRPRDLELLAVGRRATEMTWEAMRLIENGPFGSAS